MVIMVDYLDFWSIGNDISDDLIGVFLSLFV